MKKVKSQKSISRKAGKANVNTPDALFEEAEYPVASNRDNPLRRSFSEARGLKNKLVPDRGILRGLPRRSLLKRGVVEVLGQESLAKRLKSGEKLRVKFGIDPTDTNIHLGHLVVLKKVREFQRLGHQAVIIIGDWTAQIGDPSGKDKTRPALSVGTVAENARTYSKQMFKILDKSETEVHRQSEWFGKLKLSQLFEILGKVSIHELLSHETFQERLLKHQPMAVHELLYPILQGYDSVMVKADIELGAIEQKFNLLMGRTLQRLHHQSEQAVIMTPYLTGIDGKQKMSKSLGNTINLTDPPEETYGKVMSIPDKLILEYFTLCTDLTDKALSVVKKEIKTNPKAAKSHLAFLITEMLYDELAAESAQSIFEHIHEYRQVPKTIPTFTIRKAKLPLVQLLRITHLASSNSMVRRLVEQGGVKLNSEIQKDWGKVVDINHGLIIQVGKRHFAKVITRKS